MPLHPQPGAKAEIWWVTRPDDRLDRYLAREYPELSRSRLQKLIAQGYILVNGCPARASQKLKSGDRVSVTLPPPEMVSLVPELMPLTVVYEDNDLVVIDKPAGLVVHPSPGHKAHTIINALLARCPDLASFGNSLRPGIVHRLDRDTSGLMIIAKNVLAQHYLVNQFKERSVSKGYLVLVKGRLTPVRGIIDAPIGRNPFNRKRMAVMAEGRAARTSFEVKDYLNDCTLLDISTETGRTHQIRVHLAAIGHPVIGDPVYGVKSKSVKRQFVHAYRLGFRLPVTGEYREFRSELPSDLQQAMRLIGDEGA
ncbi:MAG TPA: RluA family pseudouridine synthase [Dehalococcoidia bacterium]|nr:RluA family pseudouridine synthase [Dehalococcoidia bacterium]